MGSDPTSDTVPAGGVIEAVAVADLTALTPDDAERIREIRDVALVLVPESLSGVLATRMARVASVVAVPDGARARVHTGSLVMGGDALAAPDAEDDVLVVTGTLALTSPVERVTFRQVVVTGLVLAPHGSEAALGAGLTRITGSVQCYEPAEGQRIKTLSGQLRIGPELLANEGGTAGDLLVVSGQVVLTGPVTSVGFQRVIANGQLLAPRESQGVLAPALSVDGQLVWYDGRPRVFIGDETFGRSFFELLDEPLALALIGNVRIEDDVTPQLLRDAIADITLVGRLTAPHETLGVLQLLTTEKHGTIAAKQDDGDA